MVYNSNKKLFLNLFAEFLLSKIPNNEISKFQIIDCENFFIVKGETTSKELLNLKEIKDEFFDRFEIKFPEKKIFNTIDLINYEVDLTETEEISVMFYNSNDLLSPYQTKTENLYISSEFPYGFSMKQGKNLFYYTKHLTYNLQLKLYFQFLQIKLSKIKSKVNLEIYLDGSLENDDKVTSSILDCFDFNLEYFEKLYGDCDNFHHTLENSEYEFIKKQNSNFIIF